MKIYEKQTKITKNKNLNTKPKKVLKRNGKFLKKKPKNSLKKSRKLIRKRNSGKIYETIKENSLKEIN